MPNPFLDVVDLASLAVAEGATTPSPVAGGLLYSSTTHAPMRGNGTKWTSLKRSVVLKLCSGDFTPTATGIDLGGMITVPYEPNTTGRVSIAWTVTDIIWRMETTGTTSSTLQIGRSTGTGAFTNAGYLNTTAMTIAASSYEASAPTLAVTTVNSNDKLAPYYQSLGTSAAGFTVYVVLCES